MADVSNVNRLATTRALASALETVKALAGLVVQTHRAYEATSRKKGGLTQPTVATAAHCSQATISNLEQAKSIPKDNVLTNILETCGFNMQQGHGGQALLDLLRFVRDNQKAITRIQTEKPK